MSCPPTRKIVPWLIALLAAAPALPANAEPGIPAEPRSGAAALLGSQPLVLRLNDHGWPRPNPPAAAPSPPSSGPSLSPKPVSSDQPQALLQAAPADPPPDRFLVLDRRRRVLQVFEQGKELRSFPVAVGMPGWETPVGRFEVIEKTANPVWEHPANGRRYPSGPDNPLGSRWIGFYRDCKGRSGFNGQEHLEVKGCVTAGFHGTPNRTSVGQAVSHGCVRLFDENARELFDLVRLGTPVEVLP